MFRDRFMPYRIRLFLVVALAAVAGLGVVAPARRPRAPGPAATPAPVAPKSELASRVERYSLDRQRLLRRYGAVYTPERYTRLTEFYLDWQRELAQVPFA